MADLRWLLNSCIVRDRFCQMLNSFRSTASAKPDFSLACWITNTPRTSSLLAVGLASESTCALSIQQERKLKPGKQANWSPAARISCAVIGTSRKKLNWRAEPPFPHPAPSLSTPERILLPTPTPEGHH